MPKYSIRSQKRLRTCHPDLQRVMRAVMGMGFDHTILEGARSRERQNVLHVTGRSHLQWPDSKHNIGEEAEREQSDAVDAFPYPLDYEDRERATFFAGIVIGVGAAMGVRLRWGGDWDGDWEVRDNVWDDLAHFERH